MAKVFPGWAALEAAGLELVNIRAYLTAKKAVPACPHGGKEYKDHHNKPDWTGYLCDGIKTKAQPDGYNTWWEAASKARAAMAKITRWAKKNTLEGVTQTNILTHAAILPVDGGEGANAAPDDLDDHMTTMAEEQDAQKKVAERAIAVAYAAGAAAAVAGREAIPAAAAAPTAPAPAAPKTPTADAQAHAPVQVGTRRLQKERSATLARLRRPMARWAYRR